MRNEHFLRKETDMSSNEATYQCTPERHGRGTFFFTDCCNNRMYSVKNDDLAYHGCLCPKCLWEGRYTVLYLRGTKEANRVMEERRKNNDRYSKEKNITDDKNY